MSPIERFTGACVTSATRRWPADLADDMARAWQAELAALRADTALTLVSRVWRQITFAVSLAVCPSVEQETPVPLTWRNRLARLGYAAKTLVGIVGIALLAALLPESLGGFWSNLDQHVPESVMRFTGVITIVAATAAMWWLGTVIARRTTLDGRRPALLVTATRTVPLGGALLLVSVLPNQNGLSALAPGTSEIFAAIATWTVIVTVTITIAVRLALAGRRAVAWVVGIVGSLVALDVAAIIGALHSASVLGVGAITGPAWFPLAILDPRAVTFGYFYSDGTVTIAGQMWRSGPPVHASELLLSVVSTFTSGLLLATAFVLAFAMRAVRTVLLDEPAVAAVAQTEEDVPAVRVARGLREIGFALGLAGVGVWAWITTMIRTPLPPDGGLFFPSENLIWGGLLAIALVTLAVVPIVAGRGPVAAPAAGVFAVLFAAQSLITTKGWHGAGIAVAAIAVGIAALAGAWWLAGALRGAGTNAATTRRALVAVAVAGVLTAPTNTGMFEVAPRAFTASQYVLAVLFWLLSITAALASRATPLRRVTAAVVVVVPVAVLMLFESGAAAHALYWPNPNFFVQPLLAVLALVVARWDSTRWSSAKTRLRTVGTWLVAAVGVSIVSINAGWAMRYPSDVLGASILRAHGSEYYLTHTTVIGQILFAVTVGLVAARWTVPPEAAPVTADDAGPLLDSPDLAANPA